MAENKPYITAAKEASTSLEIKKSVFIGSIKHIESEAEAQEFIKRIRAENPDARHNVWAYVFGESTARMSDDGEPQGTGGVPILDVMRKNGLRDTVIVVTRYFGGILLGAGGLVRAYSGAARAVLDASGIAEYTEYTAFSVTVSYNEFQRLQNDIKNYSASITNAEYTDNVSLVISIKSAEYEAFCKYITELTNGKNACEKKGTMLGKA